MNDSPGGASSELPNGTEDVVQQTLRTVRKHLAMEVAYLTEFVGDKSVVRAVDPAVGNPYLAIDEERLRSDGYCQSVLDGVLPELIPDVRLQPLAAGLAMTDSVPVGSHAGVPIRNPDGSIYGMLCCLSRVPNPSLCDRDRSALHAFADLTSGHLRGAMQLRRKRAELKAAFSRLIEQREFQTLVQPIVRLDNREPIGFEALSRFQGHPYRPPNLWFMEAAEVDLSVELELAAIEQALEYLNRLPGDAYLSVNASPEALLSERSRLVLENCPADRIVVEVTEHASIDDYLPLMERTESLRARGFRIAIDDTGSGIAGLHHMIRLSPDIIKLDRLLTVGVDSDPARRALANALVSFSKETSSTVVAEGIETDGELAALQSIGVFGGQGYLLGKPGHY